MVSTPHFEGPLKEREFLHSTEKPEPAMGTRTVNRKTVVAVVAIATSFIVSCDVRSVEASRPNWISVSMGAKEARSSLKNLATKASATTEPRKAWNDYIHSLSRESQLPRIFEDQVVDFWNRLADTTDWTVPIPHAGPTLQNSFILSWNRGRHHFEVEVFDDERFEWFYRDRETDDCEGDEGACFGAVAAARKFLKLLIAT